MSWPGLLRDLQILASLDMIAANAGAFLGSGLARTYISLTNQGLGQKIGRPLWMPGFMMRLDSFLCQAFTGIA